MRGAGNCLLLLIQRLIVGSFWSASKTGLIMVKKPFESRIQDLVYNVDSGIGVTIIKVLLYVLFVSVVVAVYTANQYKGLREAEAMDYAQLGRNVSLEAPWLITKNIRPLSIWYVTNASEDGRAQLGRHPDLIHAPLYPALLAVSYLGLDFDRMPAGPHEVYGPETRMMLLNHIFSVLVGVLVLLLGRRLFDHRIGMIAMSLYFLSDMVWRDSLSGTGIPVATFFAVAAVYAAVIAVGRLDESDTSRNWVIPVLLSAFLCGLAFLTRFAAVALVPGLLLYVGWAMRGRCWQGGLVFLVVFMIPASLWMARNVILGFGPLGLLPYLILQGGEDFPLNALERSMDLNLSIGSVISAIPAQLQREFRHFYEGPMLTLGNGILMAIFITTYFYRFVRFPVHALRWGLALSFFVLMGIGALFGESTFRFAAMFWPFIILYGLAFFMLLLERLQLRWVFLNRTVIGVLFLLVSLPMIFTLLPPRARITYPPYSPRLINFVSNLLEPTEMLCTDMPWATAWYGDRVSVLLPYNVEQFYDIHDYMHRFSGLYFTLITRDQPFMSVLQSSAYETWMPIMEGRIPGDFPLPRAIPLLDMDQIFFSDRARWEERRGP